MTEDDEAFEALVEQYAKERNRLIRDREAAARRASLCSELEAALTKYAAAASMSVFEVLFDMNRAIESLGLKYYEGLHHSLLARGLRTTDPEYQDEMNKADFDLGPDLLSRIYRPGGAKNK